MGALGETVPYSLKPILLETEGARYVGIILKGALERLFIGQHGGSGAGGSGGRGGSRIRKCSGCRRERKGGGKGWRGAGVGTGGKGVGARVWVP